MGVLFTIYVTSLIITHVICDVTPFTDTNLSYVVEVHDAFCADYFRCGYITVNSTTNYSSLSRRIGVLPPPVLNDKCCRPCNCDQRTCRLDRSCCPDALDQLPTVEDSVRRQQIACKHPQLRPYNRNEMANSDWAYRMYQKCPLSGLKQNSSDIISKCEEFELYDEIDTKIVVTDILEKRIFKNRYCAYCHGVEDLNLVYWTLSVQCLHDSYIPSNIDHVVSDVMETKDCNLIYKKPRTLALETIALECEHLIGSCNETGHWTKYDPVIEAACHAYGTRYRWYNNVYCYLCNTGDMIGDVDCDDRSGIGVYVSFTVLLKFTPGTDTTDPEELMEFNATCKVNQMYDSLKDTCRNISCLPPKLYRNGSCYNTVDFLGGIDYMVFLKMTPTQEISHNRLFDTVSDLENHTASLFTLLEVENTLRDFGIFYKMKDVSNVGSVDFFVVYFKLYSLLIYPILMSVIDTIIAMDGKSQAITLQSGKPAEFHTHLEVFDMITENGKERLRLDDNITMGKIYTSVFIPSISNNDYVPVERIITRQTGCPLVSIGIEEFTVTRHTWGITIVELNARLRRNEYVTATQNDSFLICMDKYKAILPLEQHNSKQIPTTAGPSAIEVLSIVCTVISVAFSLLTLLTYSLFKELRTQPGINTMCLLVSLICAQLVFQFGSGQADYVSSLVCQILGILVHFSWLMVFFWMNVCSYHMYKVFNSKLLVMSNGGYLTVKYCLYCFVSSVSMIVINIGVVVLDTDGKEIGYGGRLCYISRSIMLGLVFALPVGLVVVSNLVMFILVIMRLTKTPDLDNSVERHRNYFVIYAKISTLTGITWLFGFLTIINITAFDYIFIILNAGQGAFVFLSFVCNKRIARLYSELFSFSKSVARRPDSHEEGYGEATTKGGAMTSM